MEDKPRDTRVEDLGPEVDDREGGQEKQRSILKEIWTNRRVLSWCLLIFLLPVNFGYEIGMIGKLFAAPEFQKSFGRQVHGVWTIKTTDQQILNAANTIGLVTSAFFTGYLSDAFGRKKVLLLACLICSGGVIMQYFTKSIMMLFGGKLISVLGFGLGHSLAPVFVAELAPANLRGICLALINTMIVLGQWVGSLTVYGCSFRKDESAWRIPLIIQLIAPATLLLIAGPFLPESPSWLLINNRWEEAAKSLKRFNGPHVDVTPHLQRIKVAIDMEKESQETQRDTTWLDCFRNTNLRRTTIVCMVFLSQQFIGVNFVSGYLTYYFSLAGVKAPLAVAQGAFAVQLVGNICSWFVIERLGRRALIVGGSIVMTFGLLIIGCINISPNAASLKATVALMTLWGFIYQVTLGAVSYAVGGETPSPRVRQKTYSINIITSTAVSCMWLQTIPLLINTDKANLGGKIAFVFFAPSVPMCFYLFFCLPEMKGRSVDELEEMFKAGIPARQFESYVCTEVNVHREAAKKAEGLAAGDPQSEKV